MKGKELMLTYSHYQLLNFSLPESIFKAKRKTDLNGKHNNLAC